MHLPCRASAREAAAPVKELSAQGVEKSAREKNRADIASRAFTKSVCFRSKPLQKRKRRRHLAKIHQIGDPHRFGEYD